MNDPNYKASNEIFDAIDDAIEERMDLVTEAIEGTMDLVDSGLRSLVGTPENE